MEIDKDQIKKNMEVFEEWRPEIEKDMNENPTEFWDKIHNLVKDMSEEKIKEMTDLQMKMFSPDLKIGSTEYELTYEKYYLRNLSIKDPHNYVPFKNNEVSFTLRPRNGQEKMTPIDWKTSLAAIAKDPGIIHVVKYPIMLPFNLENEIFEFQPPFKNIVVHAVNLQFLITYQSPLNEIEFEDNLKKCPSEYKADLIKNKNWHIFVVHNLNAITENGEIFNFMVKVDEQGIIHAKNENHPTFHWINNDNINVWAKRFLHLFCLINSQNVKLIKINEGKTKNNYGYPEYKLIYHEITINGKNINADKFIQNSTHTNREHWCRGHFKNRKNGRFWWSPHIRGDESLGKVEKSYNVKV